MNYDLFMFLVLAAIATAAFKTSELGEESGSGGVSGGGGSTGLML